MIITKKESDGTITTADIEEGENFTIKGKDGKVHTGTVRIKAIMCGKKCKGCPHHIYAYLKYRDGKKTKEKYLGKVPEYTGD